MRCGKSVGARLICKVVGITNPSRWWSEHSAALHHWVPDQVARMPFDDADRQAAEPLRAERSGAGRAAMLVDLTIVFPQIHLNNQLTNAIHPGTRCLASVNIRCNQVSKY